MNNEIIFVINVPAAKSCEGDGADYWRIFHMPDVREAYFKIQKKHGFPLIDLYRLFIEYSEERNIRFEELLADGLHPNDKGHDAIFEILIG